jgi:hypothetical protein
MRNLGSTVGGAGGASGRALGMTAARAITKLREPCVHQTSHARAYLDGVYFRVTTDGYGRLLAYLDDGSTTPLPPTAVSNGFARFV